MSSGITAISLSSNPNLLKPMLPDLHLDRFSPLPQIENHDQVFLVRLPDSFILCDEDGVVITRERLLVHAVMTLEDHFSACAHSYRIFGQ